MPSKYVPDEFREIFRGLVVAFQPRPQERGTLESYWDTLRKFPLDVLQDTANIIKETRRFFPTVHEWAKLATELHRRRRPLRGLPAVDYICEWCGGKGAVRVHYKSDEPFDVAICSCLEGTGYRKAGEALVRAHLGLGPENQVVFIEDLDDPSDQTPATGVFVYAIQCGPHVKIGFSTNLVRRLHDISSRAGRDGEFIGYAAMRDTSDARVLERWLQHRSGRYRLDGEWFSADPTLIERLKILLSNPEAVARELAKAREAQQELARRPAQENFRVIVALAKDVIATSPPEVPVEMLTSKLVSRCTELKIAVDDDIAVRALRAAEWRVTDDATDGSTES